jgi:serine/threonine protein kinase
MEDEQKPRKILDNKYIIKRKIGYGAQGEIFLVENIGDNAEYVVKSRIKEKEPTKEQNLFLNEISILNKLKSKEKKYVPYLYDSGEGFIKKEGENIDENNLTKYLYLVIDYAAKGDLYYYVQKAETGFKEIHCKILFKKIIEGIKYCHESNICHLDIKIPNLLLDENFEPKITDFGLSREIYNLSNVPIEMQGLVGTQKYICPQMWMRKPYTGIDADIFSLGVVLFNLVTGKFGFDYSMPNEKYYKNIANKYFGLYWNKIIMEFPYISKLSDEFKNLYIKMISFKPEKRPRIDEILKDPWFQEINDMSEEQLNEIKEEIMEEFTNLEAKKNSDNESLSNQTTGPGYTGATANRGDSSVGKYFDSNIKPKKIRNGDKFANHYVKINGIEPVNFMNSLIEKIKNKYKFDLDCSDKKLKFEANFEIEKNYEIDEELDENDNNCTILIKMYEDIEGGYLLNFIKKKGEIDDYYKLFLEIKNIIKELLID